MLSPEELLETERLELRALLDKARKQITDFDGDVHGIVGYWDFPVSSMVPILCAELGLPGARLEAVVKCEHKYWSRIEQQKVIDEHPRFGIVDIDGDSEVPAGLDFPLWLKPVKSASSDLAFQVGDEREFTEAVAAIREGIDRIGQPFEVVLEHLELQGDRGHRRSRVPRGGGGNGPAGHGRGLRVPGRGARPRDHRLRDVPGEHELPAFPVPRRRPGAGGRASRGPLARR